MLIVKCALNATFDHRHDFGPDEDWRHLFTQFVGHQAEVARNKPLFKNLESHFSAERKIID